MTDINEMRRLVQDANQEMWVFWHGIVATDVDSDGAVVVAERPTPSGGKYQARVDARLKFIAAANPAAISELIDRLEAAEKECDALRAAVRHEADCVDAAKAEIEAMEQQEPVYLFRRKGLDDFCTCSKERYEAFSANPQLFEVKTLYALPGAQPKDEALWPTIANGMITPDGWKLVPIEPTPTMITAALESSHAINVHRAEHCYRAMLAAAPEAKP